MTPCFARQVNWRATFSRPYGTQCANCRFPASKLAGYFHTSLRDCSNHGGFQPPQKWRLLSTRAGGTHSLTLIPGGVGAEHGEAGGAIEAGVAAQQGAGHDGLSSHGPGLDL